MRIARKLTLGFAFAVLAMVGTYAAVEIADESADLRAGVVSKLSLAATESTILARELPPGADLARELGLPPEFEIRRIAPADASAEASPDGTERDGRIYVARTYTDRAGRPAALELSQSTDDIDRDLRSTAEWTLALAALILAAATGYTLLLGSRMLTRPIDELIARFRRVGAGDLTPAAPSAAERADELGRLARELDVMVAQLAASRESTAAAHAQRLAALDQVRHADRLATVGRLASGLAHELGTPLNVVAGYAKMIATGQDEGDEARGDAAIIAEQVTRMTAIVRQLLDFARRGAPKLEDSDLAVVAGRAAALAQLVADKRGVRVERRGTDTQLVARLDAARFEQVLVNLLVNAIHASPEGGVVELALAPPAERDGELRIDVIDHGSGIAADQLARIFEPFFTTKPVGEGTGLGLAVSHGIVEEHGGRIAVTSELGAGSRFSVYLPAR